MRMKKLVVCTALIFIILCSGCGKTAVTSYRLKSIDPRAIMYIEGSYSEEIEISEFESLTSLYVPQSLPPSYTSKPIVASAYYDIAGDIINMNVSIGEGNNGNTASICVYSSKLWSSLSMSSIDYCYGSDETNEFEPATVGGTAVLYFHYDDSKNNENKLGHDVYIAELEINDINVYIESRAMNQEEFELFVTSLIETAEEGE